MLPRSAGRARRGRRPPAAAPCLKAPADQEHARVAPGGLTILPNGRFLTPKGRRLYVGDELWQVLLSPDGKTVASQMADNDLALGRIVEYLSRLPEWKSMAIFVTQDDPGADNDSVDRHRSCVLAVSPYAKKGYVSKEHTSIMSILKTIYLLFGLGPNNIFDALATDLRDLFTDTPDFTPYTRVPVDRRVFKPEETKATGTRASPPASARSRASAWTTPPSPAASAASPGTTWRRAGSSALRPDKMAAGGDFPPARLYIFLPRVSTATVRLPGCRSLPASGADPPVSRPESPPYPREPCGVAS